MDFADPICCSLRIGCPLGSDMMYGFTEEFESFRRAASGPSNTEQQPLNPRAQTQSCMLDLKALREKKIGDLNGQ